MSDKNLLAAVLNLAGLLALAFAVHEVACSTSPFIPPALDLAASAKKLAASAEATTELATDLARDGWPLWRWWPWERKKGTR
ncbi:hypothetical protein COHA_010627 [Chlorella ohadii]|uniref:Uncharacterized protein n=1 Tax=Chlorella ohadii TaxID=2649997 RepID=A0AAD5DHD5_9CHLO|nr:hypothetical protein COHA_010627 [Chlorella ohadii]